MSAEPKRLAALFFLSRHEGRPVDELLRIAGATDIRWIDTRDPERGLWFDCRWAGMFCQASLIELGSHKVVAVSFWQSAFLDLLSDEESSPTVEQDGAIAVALAFRDACEALQPEAACLATHLEQARLESIEATERMVTAMDAYGLVDARFGLVYLGKELSELYSFRYDRDSLEVKEGLLAFAKTGWGRWF